MTGTAKKGFALAFKEVSATYQPPRHDCVLAIGTHVIVVDMHLRQYAGWIIGYCTLGLYGYARYIVRLDAYPDVQFNGIYECDLYTTPV
jgi:hypothetical protein